MGDLIFNVDRMEKQVSKSNYIRGMVNKYIKKGSSREDALRTVFHKEILGDRFMKEQYRND